MQTEERASEEQILAVSSALCTEDVLSPESRNLVLGQDVPLRE